MAEIEIKRIKDNEFVISVNGKTYVSGKQLGKGAQGIVYEMKACAWDATENKVMGVIEHDKLALKVEYIPAVNRRGAGEAVEVSLDLSNKKSKNKGLRRRRPNLRLNLVAANDEFNKKQEGNIEVKINRARIENFLLEKKSKIKGVYGVKYDGGIHLMSVMPYFNQGALATIKKGRRVVKNNITESGLGTKWKWMAELSEQLTSLVDKSVFEDPSISADKLEESRSQFVHGDIKPDNILLTKLAAGMVPPSAVLADYGVATKIGGDSKVVGTKKYMAPEVIKEGKPTVTSDVYSLSAVFAQLLGVKNPSINRDQVDNIALLTAEELSFDFSGNYGFIGLSGVDNPELSEGFLNRTVELFLKRMGAADPSKRPSAIQVTKFCRKMESCCEILELIRAKPKCIEDIMVVKGVYVKNEDGLYVVNEERYQKLPELPRDLKIDLLKSSVSRQVRGSDQCLVKNAPPSLKNYLVLNTSLIRHAKAKKRILDMDLFEAIEQSSFPLEIILNNESIMRGAYEDYTDKYISDLEVEIGRAGGIDCYLTHCLEDIQIGSLETRSQSLGWDGEQSLKYDGDYDDNRKILIKKSRSMGRGNVENLDELLKKDVDGSAAGRRRSASP